MRYRAQDHRDRDRQRKCLQADGDGSPGKHRRGSMFATKIKITKIFEFIHFDRVQKHTHAQVNNLAKTIKMQSQDVDHLTSNSSSKERESHKRGMFKTGKHGLVVVQLIWLSL